MEKYEKGKRLEETIDRIRYKYDSYAVIRGCFANTKVKPLHGGDGEEDYPMMSSIL